MKGVDLPCIASNFELAYKVDVRSKIPYGATTVYVDANTGAIIKDAPLYFSCMPSANTPHTLFSGPQRLNTSFNGSQYALNNTCKGGGIRTNYNALTSGSNVTDHTGTNTWTVDPGIYPYNTNIQEACYQVHWATDKYYDFLLNKFNRHSFDNVDGEIFNIIDNISPAANAKFEDTDVRFYTSTGGLTFCTVDAVGHEWGHGVSQTSVSGGFGQMGEQAAIAEGVSDILGTLFEFYTEGAAADWTMFEDYFGAGAPLTRNMANPYSMHTPDTYLGTYYSTGGDPHNNCMIMDYWFYLLSMGSGGTKTQHTAISPQNYNITGIGKDDAARVLYSAYNYITNNSFYVDVRRATLQAAIDVFGSDCDPRANVIKQAWDAVGVYDTGGGSTCGTLSVCISKVITGCSPVKATLSASLSGTKPGHTYVLNWIDVALANVYPGATVTNIDTGSYFCIINDITTGSTCELDSPVLTIYNSNTTPVTINATSDVPDICPGQCANITATGAGSINYYLDNVASTSNVMQVCPLVNTTYTVKGIGLDGCSSDTKTISIIVHQPITLTASTPYVCPGQIAVITATGANTYVLDPGGIPGNPVSVAPLTTQSYTVTGTDIYGCVSVKTLNITVDPAFCCSQGTAFATTSGSVTGGVYNLNTALTLTGDLSLSGLTIFMGVNGEIIVPNNMKLSLDGVHILGCPTMWKGIRCTGTSASVFTSNNTLIEDAVTAIDLKNVTSPKTGETAIFKALLSTFNKNYTAVNIENYTASTNYPFAIGGCVFTCRNLITSDHTTYLGAGTTNYNWNTGTANSVLRNTTFSPTGIISNTGVSTNDVFSAASYAGASLGFPYAGTISRQGIALTNVGAGSGPAFYGFNLISGINFASLNLFDNMSYGINAVNSNVKSSNAAYQFMSQYSYSTGGPFPLTLYTGGFGIGSVNTTNSGVYNLTVLPAGTGYNQTGNFFFHNIYGVNTNNIQYTNVQYAMIHTNRVYSTGLTLAGTLPLGEGGIYMQNADYTNITASNNFITNVNTGINFLASSADYPAGSLLKNLGPVTIASNTLQADYAGTPASGKVIQNGIIADNLFNCSECIANDDSISHINVTYNTINSAFRGIKNSNWQHQYCSADNNAITLLQEPNGSHGIQTTQYGILHQNNFDPAVNSNTVTGFGIDKTTVYAVKASDNTGQAILCNITSNTYEGFYFSGAQNLVTWQKNYMLSHGRGLELYNTVIGQQGTSGGAMDNIWQTGGLGWTGSNYQTYITSSGAGTAASSSKLYVRTGPTTYPTNNGAFFGSTPFQTSASIITTPFSSSYACGPTQGGGGGGSIDGIVAPSPESQSAMDAIATDNVSYSQYNAAKQSNGKRSIYNYLGQNSNATAGDGTLQSFMAQAATSNAERLQTVEKHFVTGDFANAGAVATGISAGTGPEGSALVVYGLALKAKNNTYQSTDESTLLSLCNGCPDRDGLAVYQARVFYNSLHHSYTHFEDNCSTSASSRLGNGDVNQNTGSFNNNNLIKLYPNPNTGSFSINIAETALASALLRMYNVNGQLV